MVKFTNSKLASKCWTTHFQNNIWSCVLPLMCYTFYVNFKSDLLRDILLSATPISFLTKLIGFLKITYVLNDCFFLESLTMSFTCHFLPLLVFSKPVLPRFLTAGSGTGFNKLTFAFAVLSFLLCIQQIYQVLLILPP